VSEMFQLISLATPRIQPMMHFWWVPMGRLGAYKKSGWLGEKFLV